MASTNDIQASDVGGTIGQSRWGGRLGHGGKFVFFSDVAAPFFVEEMPMRGRKVDLFSKHRP